MAELQNELERQLATWGITPEDVRVVVKLLAVSARRESDCLVESSPFGARVRHIDPLPSTETVLKLAERLAFTEWQLKETNEKLDRVLAALEKK
ncbi:hypothetical protein ACLESD_17610 [Pyxidicoccus sp. 3LFB2]